MYNMPHMCVTYLCVYSSTSDVMISRIFVCFSSVRMGVWPLQWRALCGNRRVVIVIPWHLWRLLADGWDHFESSMFIHVWLVLQVQRGDWPGSYCQNSLKQLGTWKLQESLPAYLQSKREHSVLHSENLSSTPYVLGSI